MNRNQVVNRIKKGTFNYRIEIGRQMLSIETFAEFKPRNIEAMGVIIPAALEIFEGYHQAFTAMQSSSLGLAPDPDTALLGFTRTLKDSSLTNPFFKMYGPILMVFAESASSNLITAKLFSYNDEDPDAEVLAFFFSLGVEDFFAEIIRCVASFMDIDGKDQVVADLVNRYKMSSASIPLHLYKAWKDVNG